MERIHEQVNIQYADLITVGRNSSKKHRVELCFYYDKGKVYLLSHARNDGKGTDWYKNLQINPECEFNINGHIYKCEAESLAPNKEIEKMIRKEFKNKQGKSHYNTWYANAPRIPVVLKIVG